MLCIAILALSASSLALAQQPAASNNMTPPKVLSITREMVKPGRGAAHQKLESAFARAFAQSKMQDHYLAMVSVTGPDEAWFISGYDSFAQMEKMQNSVMENSAFQPLMDRLAPQDGDLLSGSNRVIAIYRPDLSYHPDTTDSLSAMRYFDVDIVCVRPGHTHDYEELIKLFTTSSDKAATGDHWETFQVTSGAPEGTFLFFSARKDFAIYDQMEQMYGPKFDAALGQKNRDKMREWEAASVKEEEDRMFAFSPAMSYAPDSWIKADPSYWRPKPMTAKPADGMKMNKKKAASEPPPAQ
jgi:hypothetical protein